MRFSCFSLEYVQGISAVIHRDLTLRAKAVEFPFRFVLLRLLQPWILSKKYFPSNQGLQASHPAVSGQLSESFLVLGEQNIVLEAGLPSERCHFVGQNCKNIFHIKLRKTLKDSPVDKSLFVEGETLDVGQTGGRKGGHFRRISRFTNLHMILLLRPYSEDQQKVKVN